MCHMKLDMMLTDMGYKPSATPPRLGVYLTNSLEEGARVEQTLPLPDGYPKRQKARTRSSEIRRSCV